MYKYTYKYLWFSSKILNKKLVNYCLKKFYSTLEPDVCACEILL